MISCLTGKLIEKTSDSVVISCGGVGYQAFVPAPTAGALPETGDTCTIYTCMNVTDNDITLYGFSDKDSRMMFRLLTGVSGVGPKVGLSILSVLDPQKILLAISAGDYKTFTAANGVGPKLGQRIVLELKDKVGKGISSGFAAGGAVSAAVPTGSVPQAMAALTGLGYTGSEAAQALANLDPALPTAELIRLALQGIGKRR